MTTNGFLIPTDFRESGGNTSKRTLTSNGKAAQTIALPSVLILALDTMLVMLVCTLFHWACTIVRKRNLGWSHTLPIATIVNVMIDPNYTTNQWWCWPLWSCTTSITSLDAYSMWGASLSRQLILMLLAVYCIHKERKNVQMHLKWHAMQECLMH